MANKISGAALAESIALPMTKNKQTRAFTWQFKRRTVLDYLCCSLKGAVLTDIHTQKVFYILWDATKHLIDSSFSLHLSLILFILSIEFTSTIFSFAVFITLKKFTFQDKEKKTHHFSTTKKLKKLEEIPALNLSQSCNSAYIIIYRPSPLCCSCFKLRYTIVISSLTTICGMKTQTFCAKLPYFLELKVFVTGSVQLTS